MVNFTRGHYICSELSFLLIHEDTSHQKCCTRFQSDVLWSVDVWLRVVTPRKLEHLSPKSRKCG